MHKHLGEVLVEQAKSAHSRVVIVAPFIKYGAIKRLVDELDVAVQLDVFTRWTPEELVSGVSDIEVWPLISRRQRSGLYLRPGLHAKYYRFDDQALSGSANLTDKGMGWSSVSNLELLILGEAKSFLEFENDLFSTSYRVDDETYSATKTAMEKLASVPQANSQLRDGEDRAGLDGWTPVSRQVQRLYECYQGNDDVVISSVYEDGLTDLAALEMPVNLSSADFVSVVASRLRTLSVVAAIDAAAVQAIDRAQGMELLIKGNFSTPDSAEASWDIWSAWLTHFFPNRYRVKSTVRGPALERSRILR